MPSLIKSILDCLLHVFYKLHITFKCSKCCESDCILQTETPPPKTPTITPQPSPNIIKKSNENISTL